MANRKGKVLVAMSGGVDSSSVAAKMIDEGYEVEGATLDFGRFCSQIAISDAKNVAKQLGIKHHIVECEKTFEENVIKYFVNGYIEGNTPNPCVKCNRKVKFYELLKFREKIGADYLATGHYAKITDRNGIYWLEKGSDPVKDQSYFLGQLKYEYLQYIKFPLENITKKDVRNYAKKLGLVIAEKAESQDICFTNGKKYKDIITNYYECRSGDILHINGTKLGKHNGIVNYTQGQRKGLGIGYKEPLFVIKIDAKKNIVYVGSEKDLLKTDLQIDTVNFLDLDIEFEKEYELDVKLRSTNTTDRSKVIFHSNNTANITLLKPSRNVAPGQLCCIYDNARVIASGFIINDFE